MPTLQAYLVDDTATRQMLDILYRIRNIKVKIGHGIALTTGISSLEAFYASCLI